MHIKFQTSFKLVCALALPILFATASPTHSQALDQRATQEVNFTGYYWENGEKSENQYSFDNIELEPVEGSDTKFRVVNGWRVYHNDVPRGVWRFIPALAFKGTEQNWTDFLFDCKDNYTLLASGASEPSPEGDGSRDMWVICRG